MKSNSAIPGMRIRSGSESVLTRSGFTLLELLIVIGIIGILASIGLPAMKGLGESNLEAAAHRQILDDLAMARLRAINGRTTVYMVFVPPTLPEQVKQSGVNHPVILRQMTNLIPMQFTGYAMIASRTVGDQPGRETPHYLSEWKSLPDGFLFAPYKFDPRGQNHADDYMRTMKLVSVPFPTSDSQVYLTLPYIAFNSQGQLVSQRDEILPLAKGSVFYPRNDQGGYALQTLSSADVVLTPPPKGMYGTNNYQHIRINWLTGRAQAEKTEFK